MLGDDRDRPSLEELDSHHHCCLWTVHTSSITNVRITIAVNVATCRRRCCPFGCVSRLVVMVVDVIVLLPVRLCFCCCCCCSFERRLKLRLNQYDIRFVIEVSPPILIFGESHATVIRRQRTRHS
jgi:hypothetical protein